MIKTNFSTSAPDGRRNDAAWPAARASGAAGRRPENSLLAALPAEVLAELRPYLETVPPSGSEYLLRPGDFVDFVYFPETAIVSEFQILEDGRTIEIAMTGREGVIGLLPIFGGGRAANWTQISVSGRLTRLNSRILEKKIGSQPALQKLMFEYLGRYVRQVSQRSICHSYHLIEQRFCSWLLMVQDRQTGSRLSLTQEQIARALGVHRPSLTHIAQNLRTRRIIDYVRGRIHILDRAGLEKSACSCFAELQHISDEIH